MIEQLEAFIVSCKSMPDQEPVSGVTRHFTHDEIEAMIAKFHQERSSYDELYTAFWQVCVQLQEANDPYSKERFSDCERQEMIDALSDGDVDFRTLKGWFMESIGEKV